MYILRVTLALNSACLCVCVCVCVNSLFCRGKTEFSLSLGPTHHHPPNLHPCLDVLRVGRGQRPQLERSCRAWALVSPLVQTLSASEQIAPEGGERVASRTGGTGHIQVDRDWMRGAGRSSSELTSWRLLQLLGISLLIWDCSICISFAYICITRTWLAPEIEIPSLGNYVKKPLETSRNPGARETEAGSWMC